MKKNRFLNFALTIALIAACCGLAALLHGCGKNEDYLKTAHGFRIYDLPSSIDAQEAMTELDNGAQGWIASRGEEHRWRCEKARFTIFDDWQKNGYVGNTDMASITVDLAWWSWPHDLPHLPALWHELDHLVYGHFHD